MNNDKFFNISPWNILNEMLNAERPFNSMFRTLASRIEGRFPPANFYVSDKAAVIDFEMPGKNPDDVDIKLEPQAVVIEVAPKDKAKEMSESGKRRIELPFSIDADKTKAVFKNGILRLEMPKSESAKLKKITIDTEN